MLAVVHAMKKKYPAPLRKTGLPPGSLVHVGEIKT